MQPLGSWLGSCLFLVLGLSACGSPPAPAQPVSAATSPAPPGPTTPGPTTTAPGPVGPPQSGVRIEPQEPKASSAALPRVEIKFPIAEQLLSAAKAARYKVRLNVADAPPGGGVRLQLDDHRPHHLTQPNRPLSLSSLVDAERELAPGAHFLFAVATTPDGVSVKPRAEGGRGPFAGIRFYVGKRPAGAPEPESPRVIPLRTKGTLNGPDQAAAALVDFYVLGAKLGKQSNRLRVRVHSPSGQAETLLDVWRPVRLVGLESGDHRVELSLRGADGAERLTTETWITVNLDAPLPAGN